MNHPLNRAGLVTSLAEHETSPLFDEAGRCPIQGPLPNWDRHGDRRLTETPSLFKVMARFSEKERAEINRKTEAAASDTETQAQLKIEAEQMAEAKRTNDRPIAQTKKRLAEVEEPEIIGMLETERYDLRGPEVPRVHPKGGFK